MDGKIQKFAADAHPIRITVVDATDVCDAVCLKGAYGPLGTIMFGRVLSSALLLAPQTKAGHKVSVHFKGDGPLGQVYAEATYTGGCRGFVESPHAEPELIDGAVQLGSGIGTGLLSVTNSAAGQDQPHVGSVAIQTGEVGDDIAYYLQQSQQIDSIVSVGARINDAGRITAAGGVLIELMQAVPSEIATLLADTAEQTPPISEMLLNQESARDIVGRYLADLNFSQIDFDSCVAIDCNCSLDRVINSLRLLGREEIEACIQEQKDQTITCQFCQESYTVTQETLQLLSNSFE